jgi:hypothetical protein
MPLVRNTLNPVPTVRMVRIRLIAPAGWYTVDGEPREVVTYWTATIAADGTWSVEVPANADYDSDDTWYLVGEPGAVHAMVMPQTSGPHELHDLTIVMPDGGSDEAVPTAAPTTLVQLRDVDAATAALGWVLTQTEEDPPRFGFVEAAAHSHLNPSGTLSAPSLVNGVYVVTVESNWGVTNAGGAYYDPDGAVAAEAAIASLNSTGALVLTRPGG